MHAVGLTFRCFNLYSRPGDELSESFYFIPSGDEPSPLVLKRENYSLKTELEVIRKRLELAERVIQVRKDQDMQLRESIVQATREVSRALSPLLIFYITRTLVVTYSPFGVHRRNVRWAPQC